MDELPFLDMLLPGVRSELAKSRIETFEKRFGLAHLYFAQHAAFPLSLTPDLLHRIWANFQQDTEGTRLGIPWIAAADLLLSNLCNEVSYELYEMDLAVRKMLIHALKEKFGDQRLIELSNFLLSYIQQQLSSHDSYIRDSVKAQQWMALAYTHPGDVARDLALGLRSSLAQNDRSKQIRMASLIETFAEPLSKFMPLLAYARGVGYLVRGHTEQAATQFGEAAGQELLISVQGVSLPLPEPVRENIQRKAPPTPLVHYTNAKVVILGDSGVGKSGLGLVLAGQPFFPTESTHGRRIWVFDTQEIELSYRRKEIRETLLWDLAGQPGYRLFHQLQLNEVAVALVVFDARSETDPFAGVYYWNRALRQTERIQGVYGLPMKRFLVAARIDRGGRSVSPERIESLVRELSFDGYFETSAKEKQGIAELAEAIKQAIDWSVLPKVTSNDLFQQIKAFLISEKESLHLLSTADDLYRTFLKSLDAPEDTGELYTQFETCIGRVESRDLIRRLSFGNLVLLQPELLDSYASALVNAVKEEPDGLGSIAEEKVRTANFSVPREERLKDMEQEKLLLIAMVEDLLRHEIVLREQADEGSYLVFPSLSTRENPGLPDPEGKAVMFDFEGSVQNIFATLAVRLSHSGVFKKKETWKDAVTFTARVGGTYGMFLHNIGDGHAELTLFYEKPVGEETRFYFEEYVHTHLQRRAIAESIKRRRIFVCPECETPLDDLSMIRRRERGYDWITCGVCDTKVSIIDKEERLTPIRQSVVQEMDRSADVQRDLSAAASKLQGKIATGDFDVFLCHNTKAKPIVKEIGEKLKEQGILPWLDEWELRPGLSWQQQLEKQLKRIKSVAVFVGRDGIGPWQQEEVEALLIKFANRNCPVIPVLLPDAPRIPRLPIFLESMTWVDFRKQEPDPMQRLIWGITGERERFE